MDDELVQALRDAMDTPFGWTHRASPDARHVLMKLEEQGYRLVRAGDATLSGGPKRDAGVRQIALTDLMDELDAQVTAARIERGRAEGERTTRAG
jgi:hypothetical protein